MAESEQSRSGSQPWGRVVALLAGCVVTLIGVARDVRPETICVRALCAAVALGGMAALVQKLISGR